MKKSLLPILALLALAVIGYVLYDSKAKERQGADIPAHEAAQVEQAGNEFVVPDEPAAQGDTVEAGSSWQWQRSTDADGTVTEAKDPARFVLTFNADGTFSSTSDCNALRGTLALDEEIVSMGAIASTKMFCEGSQEDAYRRDLELVASGRVTGDTLTLVQIKDAGTMTFVRSR